jgi:UV DNA damage endonuclease
MTLIEWNHQNNIHCFRISSDLFPHFTDNSTEPYTIDFARDQLQQIGQLAKKYDQHLLMHPSQFNQIGSPTPSVYQNTVADLSHHAQILDMMGMDEDSVIIVHGGGVYGNKTETMRRWTQQHAQLPDSVKRRLVIENCEKNYSIEDCLVLSQMCTPAPPCVFDFHHYQCWRLPQRPIEDLMPHILKTWSQTQRRHVVMHVSDQDPSKRCGAHADYVAKIPEILFKLPDVAIDLEIEAKMKEQAILRLYSMYCVNSQGHVGEPKVPPYPPPPPAPSVPSVPHLFILPLIKLKVN